MLKWYQETENQHDVFVAGRIRLVRNVEHYPFPAKLAGADRKELAGKLESELQEIGTADGKCFRLFPSSLLDEMRRGALKERRAVNEAGAEKEGFESLMLSEDESVSLLFCGEDHIRLQCIEAGAGLSRLWEEAGMLDDYINKRFGYAFHEKYGYLTAYPTNAGTGMRAAVTLHLPMLSVGKQFHKLVNEISRFGVTVRGLYGEGSENYGAFYEVSNQKTLGVTEEEMISLVKRMAGRLAASERKVRSLTLKSHRVDLEDEIFKSYGVLKYAKKLSVKEAMTYLSQVRMGEAEGLLQLKTPLNFYGLMMEIQPSNMKLRAPEEEKSDLKQARASYIRKLLPELV